VSKPCAAVPDYIWISDSLVVRPCGNKGNHKHKMAWTPALEGLAHRMHENGDTWGEIARILYEQTGVRMTDNGVSDYINRKYGDR
jgi:hypothetical protein